MQVVVVTLGAAGVLAALSKRHPRYAAMRAAPPLQRLPQVAALPPAVWGEAGDLATVSVGAIAVPAEQLCNTLGAGVCALVGCFEWGGGVCIAEYRYLTLSYLKVTSPWLASFYF